MAIINKRIHTKEARKELADLILNVVTNKSIEKDYKVITWSNTKNKFSVLRKVDFTVTATDFLICDWIHVVKYELAAKDALEQRGIVQFRKWFDADFENVLQKFQITTNDPYRLYEHVNERYTRLTGILDEFKEVQGRNKKVKFGDDRDIQLARELKRVGFRVDYSTDDIGFVFVNNVNLVSLGTVNHITGILEDIKECNSFNVWKNCDKYLDKEDQYQSEIKTISKMESLVNKIIEPYYNLKGILTYIEFLKQQVPPVKV